MTISSEDRVDGPYPGTGAAVPYLFEFKVFADTDILAEQINADGSRTTLSLGDYTVFRNADQDTNPGGTVTATIPVGAEIVLTSQVPALQPVNITNSGGFFPAVLNAVFDRLTILHQQLAARVTRSLQFPISDTNNGTLPVASLRANKALVFDDDGNPTVSVDDYEDQAAAAAASAAAAAASEAGAAISESNAAVSEAGAETQRLAAEAAAAAAAAAAAEGLYNEVLSKSFADSPFVPLAAEEGVLYRVDCSGGNVVVNLNTLAAYGEDMKFGFVKVDGSANTLTINRGGTNTINGGTSVVMTVQWETHALIGDLASGSWVDVIQAAVIPDGAITRPKLADGALSADAAGRAKMADSYVNTAKMADGAVTQPKLANEVAFGFAGFLNGLTLSNNGTDPTNDIDIAVGTAAADTSPFRLMNLASTLTKRLDAAWAVGTGNGGLDTGTIANGTYHIFLIQRSDTGVVDALFSASATSPTLPANYDRKRRIGSIVRSAGAILAFRQNGDQFEWVTPVADIDVTTPGTSAVTRALTVPTGIVVDALMVCFLSNAGAGNSHRFSALDTTDVAVGTGAANSGQLRAQASQIVSGQIRVRTNTSGQIRSRNETANADVIRCGTWGWTDTRGRI